MLPARPEKPDDWGMAAPPSPPASPKKRTLYDILGVSRDATALDIGIAYKARIAALDRNAGADPNEVNLVHEAYHVLCMPNERAAYDARLVSIAEKAAAKEAAQNPDLVLEPEAEEAPPVWKNRYVLTGAALAIAVIAFWASRPPPKPPPRIVAQRELRPEDAPAPATAAGNAAVAIAPVALEPKSAETLFAQLAPSTARITVYDVSGRAIGLGSGVVTGPGTVITNCHVAIAGGSLTVKVGAEQYSASVEVADEEYDLCRLSVSGLGAPAVTIGSADSLRTGQKVYAIGAPQGLDLTISDGIVSGMRDLPQGRVIQTTAPISPGSSGGPLFDVYGRLVGIMTFQHRTGQNLNFAVPADWIANLRSRPATNPLTEAMSRSMAPN
jgi:S1-C subfamily serine protease